MAEAAGVFFYVFPGISAITSFTVNTTGALPVPFYGNILQVGFGFAIVSLNLYAMLFLSSKLFFIFNSHLLDLQHNCKQLQLRKVYDA